MKETLSEPISFIDKSKPFGDLALNYLLAMKQREQKRARDLVMSEIDNGVSIKEIYLYIFQPVMYEIGRLWQIGEISVGQEHYCTNATQSTMSILYPKMFTGQNSGKRMLATCVQGELHELGLRMVTDFFEMEGWDTHYLGANTPYESIVSEIEEKSPDVLAIGVTMYLHLEKAQKMIEAVRKTSNARNITILLGGYPFRVDRKLWEKLGADGCADNAQEAISLAAKLSTKTDAVISNNNVLLEELKTVSQETLAIFDSRLSSVEEDVLRSCVSEDNPQDTMGPEAEKMILSGLGFISTLLRSTLQYGSNRIMKDQLTWSKSSLPKYGVSMSMIMKNFERYDRALQKKLSKNAYEEIQPYLTSLINLQNSIVKDTSENNAG